MPQQRQAAELPGPGDIVVRSMHLRAVRADAREADFVFSTDAEDRYGEVVDQATWQLGNFGLNPVALYAHNSRELPIGRAKDVGVVDGELRGTIVFASADGNPRAENVWKLVQEGVLRAVSVGFYSHSYRWEQIDDRERLVLSDNELIEISVVPIPANPEALARMRERAIASAKAITSPKRGDATPNTQEATVPDEKNASKAALEVKDAELSDKNKALETVTAERDDERSKREVIEQRCTDLEAARTEQQARADAFELEIVDRDLAALVGKKLTAAEKPGMVKLFQADREVYATQLDAIKARPDMPQAAGKSVMGADPAPPAPTVQNKSNPGAELAAAVNKRVNRR